jgi:integrase/recombinase XerD
VECELRKWSHRTIKSHHNNLKNFFTYLDVNLSITELEQIKTPHIKKYVLYLNSKGLKPTYINGILKAVRAYFKYVTGEGYIAVNPALKVDWQREGKVVIQTFTDEEVGRMMNVYSGSNYLSVRNKLILAVAFDTGARNTEICSIREQDVRDNVILIHGKGNKERHVPLTPYLRKLIARYRREKQRYFADKYWVPDYLLLSRTGRQMTKEAMERVFREAGECAEVRKEIRCSPHTARHYYAQAHLRNGLDVYSVSRLLGHENINITKRYLQSLQDENIVERAVRTSPLRKMKL